MRLDNRIVLITAAGTPVGRAMAMTFAHTGARVIIADLHLQAAEEIAATIDGAVAAAVDVAHAGSLAALVRKTIDTFGRIDVLCNNTGLVDLSTLRADMTNADLEHLIQIAVSSTFLVNDAVLTPMAEQGGGVIINTAHRDDDRNAITAVVSAATRTNVASLSKNTAKYHAEKGIRCHVLLVGEPEEAANNAVFLATDDGGAANRADSPSIPGW